MNFLEDIIGGDSDDNNSVTLNDGSGNSVRIGYFKNVRDHGELFTAKTVDFQTSDDGKVNRISIRSHHNGSGTPQAIIYMYFQGQNAKFYNKISDRIRSYEYESVKITPYKK